MNTTIAPDSSPRVLLEPFSGHAFNLTHPNFSRLLQTIFTNGSITTSTLPILIQNKTAIIGTFLGSGTIPTIASTSSYNTIVLVACILIVIALMFTVLYPLSELYYASTSPDDIHPESESHCKDETCCETVERDNLPKKTYSGHSTDSLILGINP